MNRKKGISSILGAIVVIQIVALSLALILYFTSLNTKIYDAEYTQMMSELQNAPITVLPTINGPKILSSTAYPISIKYIIYPNGAITSTNLPIPSDGTYINFNGYPWVIIVLNNGQWYNISDQRIVIPNIADYRVFNVYSSIVNQDGKLSPGVKPAIYGNDINPSQWTLISNSLSSYTPYGITNAIVETSENQGVVRVPLKINQTTTFNYFDIAIPYNGEVYAGTSVPYSYYLPLEFNINEKNYYTVPLYNVTLKVGIYSSGYKVYETYCIELSYVTYNMIYFLTRHNGVLYYGNQGDFIQLINYTYLGNIVATNMEYGSAELGELGTGVGPNLINIALPGYNNYSLANGELFSTYKASIISSGYPYFAPYLQVTEINSTEYINITSISETRSTELVMMISGGNLDYNTSGNIVSNLLNYSYVWYFNVSLNVVSSIIVYISPNSQISLSLDLINSTIINPSDSYIYYTLSRFAMRVGNNYTNPQIVTGFLPSSSGYLQLEYPLVDYFTTNPIWDLYYNTWVVYYYVNFIGFRPITLNINYNAPFLIMINSNLYYPFNTTITA
ncbi:hypothetical protein BFU36_05670 [Sulfolobus sp. A20]|uniref:hypothetical protein n=1 Tax=Sulfolobaceae TaxID=118883 RepID=UPI000845E7C5|nr:MULTISPECIES: hypothetical protein [unclassified Sulfolobus]TRM77353.1 flagellar hook-basal body protein [Sulfolobus sp. A20-N-F8]TRM79187.1 flagellar hook-basal body protein [Sulfolobus sp. B5]TRM81165.1 flagellar hook-basal body protein [Sulfolobus sp. D5]TRM86570.1 flagellar hook-basal body protein [Sulfolobus sp. C3]TRN00666.1 flagellar hook-basal body protein [Sulfolobus sp. F1]TRN04227.1 flagellar hook-basal body protein [Sulfolobus sp. E1]